MVFFFMNFWERVEIELEYKDISQKELAYCAGISESTISSGKTRKNTPNAETAVKIAKILHVSVEYLVLGCDSELPADYAVLSKYKDLVNEFEKISPEKRSTVKKYVTAILKAGRR